VLIVDFIDGELSSDLDKEIDDDVSRIEALVRREGRPTGMITLDLAPDRTNLAAQLEAAALLLPAPIDSAWSKLEPTSWPMVTVAIPTTFGKLDSLGLAVASIARLDYPDFEIVLVDNRLVPNEKDHAQVRNVTDHSVQILHEPERGISAARNRALRSCESPFIVFTDDDVQVEPDWLRQLMKSLLADARVTCATGLVIPTELSSPGQSTFEHFFGGFNRAFVPALYDGDRGGNHDPLFPYAAGRFGTGANTAFRTGPLKELGGFDTALGTGTPARGGEDLAIFIQILSDGGSIAFEPSAIVHHMHPGTRGEVFSYGVGLTAMYTALVVRDRRHLRAIAHRLPNAMRLYLGSGNGTVRKNAGDTAVPILLRLWHAAGMAMGPPLYFLSRRQHPGGQAGPSNSQQTLGLFPNGTSDRRS
jgi:glycosyltransferase involved in cell wall biosynthesis